MHYLALACDYDGTLAWNEVVSDETLAALKQVRESGRKLILVTGRELDQLKEIFPHFELFDWVVAENGALLFQPSTRTERTLGETPPEQFINTLRQRQVEPLSVGRVIVATWQPHETVVLETIRDLGLEMQVIFNKGAVMVLPTGINKAAGLKAAVRELGLSPHNVVGIGDAENDHAFLSLCECGVAVANALQTVKERADFVTKRDHGSGVVELIEQLLESDLREVPITRHEIVVGTTEEDREVRLRPYDGNILVAGSSQGGKTTLTVGIIERIAEKGYQICVIDPEGDYSSVENFVTLGSEQGSPTVDEVMELITKPNENVVVNLLATKLEDRPAFFTRLLPRLIELSALTGRPHWIVIDEAHHLLPSSFDPAALSLPRQSYGLLMITVEPGTLAADVLTMVHTILAVGESTGDTIRDFCKATGETPPPLPSTTFEKGEALIWSRGDKNGPVIIRSIPPKSERRRHRRKYAEGELPEDRSFYFRGPEGKLNLRAQNLLLFLQLAEGVDDETWLYHLDRGDYSRWFREEINDDELGAEGSAIEKKFAGDARKSRDALRAAIEEHYTAPA
jgi:phosphoglycolate phosphatase (TIGR01487 family)